jgi:hypothetical protein
VAGFDPNITAEAFVKAVPVMMIVLFPTASPAEGLKLVIVGAGRYV